MPATRKSPSATSASKATSTRKRTSSTKGISSKSTRSRVDSVAVDTAANETGAQSDKAAVQTQLKERVARVMAISLGFVKHPEFAASGAPEKWSSGEIRGWRRSLYRLPAEADFEETDISRLCETGLLSAEQEVELFRTMNRLRFGAQQLREKLNLRRPQLTLLNRIEEFTSEAEQIRNHVVQANVRLVIAIVKRLIGPQHHFDEFVSDGMLSLMQVVEKFDFNRGFRFSTYAYRAITRTVYRKMVQVHKQETRSGTGMDEVLMEVPDRSSVSLSEGTWSNLRELLTEFMQHLDPREQMIIHARYALGMDSKGATFQALADELGVSKERVRQLERRAVTKLQTLADEVDLDQFVEASCA